MPTSRLALRPLLLATLLLCTSACNTTTLSTTWKDPSTGAIDFKKVVAVVLNSSPAERRAQEDTLAANIKRTTVVPSYLSIPDALLSDAAKAKAKIIEGGFDGALVLRLVDTRQETTYVSPSVSTWDDGWGWGYSGFQVYDPSPHHVSPGYTATDTFIRSEISLFEVPSGRLLWSGASETMNPADARAFVKEVMKAAAAELRKQKLIQ